MKKVVNKDQLRILVKFMERHGDLRRCGATFQPDRIKKKWLELIEILNRQGHKKTLAQWRKFWSDTKYNTIRKYKNSLLGGPQLTHIETAIIKIIKDHKARNITSRSNIGDNATSEEVLNPINPMNDLSGCEKVVKEEITMDNESHGQEQSEVLEESVFYVLPPTEQQPHSVLSSNSSANSFVAEKRRKSSDSVERLDEIANKFYELERERDRMAHEREMARIHQHNEFLSVMSRLVTVVETLVPSLQKFLDNNTSSP